MEITIDAKEIHIELAMTRQRLTNRLLILAFN